MLRIKEDIEELLFRTLCAIVLILNYYNFSTSN